MGALTLAPRSRRIRQGADQRRDILPLIIPVVLGWVRVDGLIVATFLHPGLHVMIARFMSAALVAALAGCAPSTQPSPAPAQSRERVFSTEGYSFLPPQGSNWHEEFGKQEIAYTKQTHIQDVTFFAGAVETKVTSKLPDKATLAAFVRLKKNQWGDDGRLRNISSTFQVEAEQESCVRYWLSADDRKAKNKGRHEFLKMQAVGRFCLHQQDRAVAVDVFYSVRHVPQFDPV